MIFVYACNVIFSWRTTIRSMSTFNPQKNSEIYSRNHKKKCLSKVESFSRISSKKSWFCKIPRSKSTFLKKYFQNTSQIALEVLLCFFLFLATLLQTLGLYKIFLVLFSKVFLKCLFPPILRGKFFKYTQEYFCF